MGGAWSRGDAWSWGGGLLLGVVCSGGGGGLLPGGGGVSAPRGAGIPACTEADPLPPVNRMNDRQV